MNFDFANKTVAVLGMARSGLACAEVLTELGAHVRLYDAKPAEQLTDGIAAARALGIEPRVDGIPVDYAELDVLITSPGVRKDAPVLQEALRAGVLVWGEIEAAYRIARAPILAITGTNGKTTTTVLLGEMLKAAGIETYIAGNIAAGDLAMPLIKAAYLAGPNAAIVAEISSFQLEWIETFRPKVAALLNITPDHGDRQTWEEYVAAKWRIFENQTNTEVAVLNDELWCDRQMQAARKVKSSIWLFGIECSDKYGVWAYNDGIYVAHAMKATVTEMFQKVCDNNEIKLPGEHNRENICAAAAMATAFGVGVEPIRQVATTFTGVVHRLEYVDTIDGVRYINNSMCTNVAAFEKSLEALPESKVIIAGGVFKGDDVTPLAKAVVKNNVRALVLIGRSGPEIADAARKIGYENVHLASFMQDALHQAKTLAQPGDTVLLAPACASFDMFRDFEDRGDQFKLAVRELQS
jgi:UDP-N-acetylmuramoylalanine--D-glutamate ligase